jgi:conjugative relaxase-like TrwC/TraI family protein
VARVTLGNKYKKTEYYKDGEFKGFKGEIAKELGLTKFTEFTPEAEKAFEFLDVGSAPSGKQLVQFGNNGEHDEGRDFTISLSKSVSMACVLSQNPEYSQAIKDQLIKSSDVVMDYLEKNGIEVTIDHGKSGREYINTGKIVYAQFLQYDARPVNEDPADKNSKQHIDMDVHLHNPFWNITKTQEGKWKVFNLQIPYQYQVILEKMFNTDFSRGLNEKGIDAYIDKNGYTQLRDRNPIEVEKEFSGRTEQGRERAKEKGIDIENNKMGLRNEINGMRNNKTFQDKNELREEWKERYIATGQTKDLERKLGNAIEIKQQMTAKEFIIKALEQVSENNSTFTKNEILQQAYTISKMQHSPQALEKAFKDNSEAVKLSDKGDTRKTRTQAVYTTKTLIKNELSNLKTIGDNLGKEKPLYKSGEINQMIKSDYSHFDDSQKKVFKELLMSKNGIDLIQAKAGSGKTTLSGGIKEAYQKQGYDVVGLAPTNKARIELTKKLKIDTYTIDKYILSEKHPQGKTLYIVDEATMIDTNKMKQFLDHAKTTDSRIIFMGDIKQLPSVGAGHEYKNFIHRYEYKELTQIHRQKNKELREIANILSEKKIDLAIEKMKDNKMFITPPEGINKKQVNEYLKNEIVKEYMKAPDKYMILTPTNPSKDDLNLAVREELIKSGRVERGERVTVNIDKNLKATELNNLKHYEPGMLINAMKDMDGLKAGQQGKILSIDPEKNFIRIENRTTGQTTEIDVLSKSKHYTLSEEKQKELGKGDRLMVLESDNKLGLYKNDFVFMKDNIKSGNYTLVKEDGQEVKTNLKEFNSLNHAYALTFHKSQGSSMDVIKDYRNVKQLNQNLMYVGETRAIDLSKSVTPDIEKLRERMKTVEEKKTNIDYANKKDIEKEMKGIDRDRGIYRKGKAEMKEIAEEQARQIQEMKRNEQRNEIKQDRGIGGIER